MAIFIDGINDCFFKNGLPATHGIYREAINNMNHRNSLQSRNIHRSKTNFHFLKLFLQDLPLFKLIDILTDRLAGDKNIINKESNKLTTNEIDNIIENYIFNVNSINAIISLNNLKAYFIWQPTPNYQYKSVNLHNKLSKWKDQYYTGHQNAKDVYKTFSNIKKPKNFIWLADMQRNEKKGLYLDSIHYNNYFSQKIASEIFNKVKESIRTKIK